MYRNWTEPLVKLFAESNTISGIYMKNEFIAYICKFRSFTTAIDNTLCYIQKYILCAHNLNMEGKLRVKPW